MPIIPVTVHGAEGRMGRLVTDLVDQTEGIELTALITEVGRCNGDTGFHPHVRLTPQDKLATVHPAGGVIVDFSLAPALEGLLEQAKQAGAGLVIGTTGHTPEQLSLIEEYAAELPVVMASNFSFGIPVMTMQLERLADVLPESFQAEQVEIHHRHKVDMPSGTARTLSTAWTERRGGTAPPTHALRIGGITGEHRWVFADEEETIEIVHRAHSRRAFLRGIVPSIRFVAGRDLGLYDMGDVLAEAAVGR
jgi:4-hydroxy-tetrahydrodipicolinate reductase